MKRFRMIVAIGLAIATVAVGTAVGFLVSLYYHEKEKTMETVRACAENADIVEMIGPIFDKFYRVTDGDWPLIS